MLLEVLEKQKKLDSWLGKGKRKRNYFDICMSAVAECVELNEEFENEFRHKTWKPKEYDESKMREELVDVLFFLAQLINKSTEKMDRTEFVKELEGYLTYGINDTINLQVRKPSVPLSKLINYLSQCFSVNTTLTNSSVADKFVRGNCITLMLSYGKLCGELQVDYDTLINLYNAKLEKNLNREDFKKAVAGGLCE